MFAYRDVVSLRDQARTIRDARAEAITLQERERHRIADKLRDGPAQLLANLAMELRSLLYLLDDDIHSVRGALESMLHETEEGLAELREIIEDLYPPFLFRELGLLAWLKDFSERYSERYGLDIVVDAPETLGRMASSVESVLLRVIQESMRNVLKHANATQVVIRLRRDGNRAVLEIQDNGQGLDPAEVSYTYTAVQARETFGFPMMKQWAEMVNGELRVQSAPNKGTLVRLVIPNAWKEGG